ncbi:hypothetical protein AB0O20_24910 [Streptomyces kronopolitis]|uniref:hypothetical protein n=1 Tax=Streptomyces kronopolitis TaxID=1612435 RepID=UPI00343BCE8B
MPTAIAVTSPDLALPATDRQTPAAVVLQAPHLQPLDEALTETGAVLEHHGHIVALYSSACPPAHIRRLHTLRAVLESDRIAIVPLSLPPLGVAVLARQLRQLSLCDFSPGVLASAARLLSHYLHAGALLGSVGGLDRIEVDLRSHVKSWLPGVHFAVLAHPAPRLLQLDRHGGGAGLPAPGFTTQLALARGQFTGDWVSDTLAPAWQVQGVFETRLPAESAEWWGTRKLVEFAAGIPDLSVLHQLVSSVLRERCGWCGLELLGDRCAFCAAPLARPRTAGGGGPAQGPAAIAAPAPRAVAEAPPVLPHPPAAPSAVPDAPEAPAAHRAPAAPDAAAVRGPQYPPGGPVAPGNPYGSGPPVPGNPYASDGPRAPGRRDLPGQASFAGHPDLSGRPGAPGTPRTVARVR